MRKKSQAGGREREGKARAQLKRLTFWGHVAGAVLHVPLVCLAACLCLAAALLHYALLPALSGGGYVSCLEAI